MALHWFEGICAAVAYLHDHGIVHRDLKPANIFIDENRVKIGDYGLSKFISCSRRSGQTESVGTVHYMAPEIANGRYGREIDAYALGIILFEMLTGHVPFEGESVGEVLMKHLTAEPDLSRVEEPYRSVIRGAMAKDPERRVDSAAEMMAMLSGVPRTPVSAEAMTHAAPFVNRSAAGSGSPWIEPPSDPHAVTVAHGPATPARTIRAFFHRDPEPVMEGLRRGWSAFTRDLNTKNWPPPMRFFGGFFAIIAMMFTWPLWMVCGFSYVVYRVLRLFVQVVTDPPSGAPTPTPTRATPAPLYASPAASAAEAARQATPSPADGRGAAPTPVAVNREAQRGRWRRRGQATWRFAAYQELAGQPLRRRTSTILASMLSAAAIAPVASLLACLFTIRDFNVELFLWASIVGTLSAWAILIPGQLAEGRIEDQAPMRFIGLLTGAFVGLLAWGVAHALYLDLPGSREFFGPNDTFSANMLGWRSEQLWQQFDQQHVVTLPLSHFAAYFAFLFAAIRWWKQSEWTRPSRVSFWAMAWAGAAAFFVGLIWWFPQPLGILAAAVISFTVQLASPWLPPSRRKQLAQEAVTA
jgi:hypothetical protein